MEWQETSVPADKETILIALALFDKSEPQSLNVII